MGWNGPLNKVDDFRYKIPKSYKPFMRTDGLIYLNDELHRVIKDDRAPEQVANVAALPGIIGPSMAMPDIHWGYGFPIGGVAAIDADDGVVSPGGVGYDINCGVRLVRTDLTEDDVRSNIRALVDAMFRNVPSGLGSKGKVHISKAELETVLEEGARWAVENGYGWDEDLERLEENGVLDGADHSVISNRAKQRGMPQLGSLGAGNHFLEIQRVDEIYEPEIGRKFGITDRGQIAVMIHTGSRGCGYQICDDQLKELEKYFHKEKSRGSYVSRKFDIELPDRQLVCAPMGSRPAERYMKAMRCAANYAWTNRQMIVHWIREAFEQVLDSSAEEMGMEIVYDVAHNMAKIEEHRFEGKRRKMVVHRKGATRAFGPGRKEVPQRYRDVGQPVLIPGDMGTASYLLAGTESAMEESWGSTCHGAGRLMSRSKAKRKFRGSRLIDSLGERGIYIRAASKRVVAEEAPGAYKNVSAVVDTTEGAGISKTVARLTPLGVVKG